MTTLEEIKLNYLYKVKGITKDEFNKQEEFKGKQREYKKLCKKTDRYNTDLQDYQFNKEKGWEDLLLGKRLMTDDDLNYIKAIAFNAFKYHVREWRMDDEICNLLLVFVEYKEEVNKYMKQYDRLPPWSHFDTFIKNVINTSFERMNRVYKHTKRNKPLGVDGVYFGPINFDSNNEDDATMDKLNATPYQRVVNDNTEEFSELDTEGRIQHNKDEFMRKFNTLFDASKLPTLMSVKELSDLVGYSPDYIRKLIREKKIEYYGAAKRNRLVATKGALEALLGIKVK